ncbi:cellulose binding domain-containing protein, partial [Micromonospora sp. M51]|uniref:cellulose binding domain-containing protein n=1 Tax=Micromonospora sp. M51 TaxID=2824889 RepID=UPI001B397F21
VYTVWQASHFDQSYYLCSDVDFGGGSTTPPPTTPPPTTPPPTTPPPTTPPPSTPPPAGACTATYQVTGQWSGGFQADVKVTAGGSPTRGWSVTWNYANGQQVTSSWNATVSSSGTQVTARNASHNGTLAAGASTTFGFLGSWNGSNPVPLVSCTTTS